MRQKRVKALKTTLKVHRSVKMQALKHDVSAQQLTTQLMTFALAELRSGRIQIKEAS